MLSFVETTTDQESKIWEFLKTKKIEDLKIDIEKITKIQNQKEKINPTKENYKEIVDIKKKLKNRIKNIEKKKTRNLNKNPSWTLCNVLPYKKEKTLVYIRFYFL